MAVCGGLGGWRRPSACAAARRSAIGRLMLRATPSAAAVPSAIEISRPPP
jgi:hypothetical protein